MRNLREAAEMVVDCFDNDYGQIAKDIAISDLRDALKHDKEELVAALEGAARSLEFAAMVIKDIPPKSEFMMTLAEVKALIEKSHR